MLILPTNHSTRITELDHKLKETQDDEEDENKCQIWVVRRHSIYVPIPETSTSRRHSISILIPWRTTTIMRERLMVSFFLILVLVTQRT
jgi:hypothetical protein